MKRAWLAILLAMNALIAAAAPPVAPREPKDVSVHGERRIDDYYYLRERHDPRVLAYLKAENAYSAAWFAPLVNKLPLATDVALPISPLSDSFG